MLLVVGWDGACWELADRFLAAGAMPNLQRLLERGRSYEVESTVPAVTFPAWTTFMTGAGPGRHGITDFTVRRAGSYGVAFVNATHRRLPTIWRHMAESGAKVGVYAMPATFPPEKACELEVCGFDTPLGASQARGFCHPAEAGDEIRRRYGSLAVEGLSQSRIDAQWHERALESLLGSVRLRTRIVSDLLLERAFDVFAVHYMESDTVAHHFWQFHDPDSPRRRAGPARAVEMLYRELDVALGRLLEAAGRDVSLLLVSDHGSGGAGARAVAWNRCLADLGLLSFAAREGRAAPARFLRSAALAAVPRRWQAPLFGALPALASQLESASRLAGIDWSRTRAYSEELPYFPSLWLNLAGREPRGIVSAAEADGVLEEITASVLALRDPDTGHAVVRTVRRRQDVCQGPWAHQVPDLILDLHEEPEGYTYGAIPSRGGAERAWLRTLRDDELSGAKGTSTSGVHRRQGMGLLVGPHVSPGPRSSCTLADAGVTALAMAGVAPSGAMEGHALVDAERPLAQAAARWEGQDPEPYTADQEEQVAERLRALGYLP